MLTLLALRPTARLLRKLARRWISQDSTTINVNVTQWHHYKMILDHDVVTYELDGHNIWKTSITPRGALGFLVWVDNQYAALPPDGKLSYGTLENTEPTWIEVMDLCIS
jgi:hypothetical protein